MRCFSFFRFRNRRAILLGLCLLAPRIALAQFEKSFGASSKPIEIVTPAKEPVETEVTIEGLASYGNYKIFASGTDCKLYTAGVEYDRHTWGYFLKARMDYVAEILPIVLLNKPAVTDFWGNPYSLNRQLVPGLGFSPIGFRMMWRPKAAIRPYFTVKGGALVFDKKVPATEATYENFSLQQSMGVEVTMKQRMALRLGLFSDVHFSNGFMHDSNPGLDVMNANLGLSYRFGEENRGSAR